VRKSVTYTGTFESTSCLIAIDVRPNVEGGSSYVATPYVLVDHGIQPFAVSSDRIEIAAETEAEALQRAVVFLQHRFGLCRSAPRAEKGAASGRRQLQPRP
jgi:hypothetical protein